MPDHHPSWTASGAADTPQRVVDLLTQHHGGVNIVVHDAGVTRDRTRGRGSVTR